MERNEAAENENNEYLENNDIENIEAAPKDKLLDRLAIARLFDCYGRLLANRQQQCLSAYINDDLTVREMGEILAVSRQAVFDNIKRGRAIMEDYEAKLGILAYRQRKREQLGEIHRKLAACDSPNSQYEAILKEFHSFIENEV